MLKQADELVKEQPKEPDAPPQPLVRNDEKPITIALSSEQAPTETKEEEKRQAGKKEEKPDRTEAEFDKYVKQQEAESKKRAVPEKRGKSEKPLWERGLEQLIQAKHKKEEERMKEEAKAPEEKEVAWIAEGIVVKMTDKAAAGGKYYGKKGIIRKLPSKFVAELEMLDSHDVIRADQDFLETVVPNIGGPVMLLVGDYRGKKGAMRGLHIDEYKASIETEDKKILKVAYECFSKLFVEPKKQ